MTSHQKIKPGFTLTEVVVSMFIISLLIAMAGGLSRLIGRANVEASHTAAAASTANTKLEEIRNTRYANISSHSFTDSLPSLLPHPRSGQVTVTQPRTGVKRAVIVITYDGVSQTYVTHVSEDGISGS